MKFSKYLILVLACSVTLLSACGDNQSDIVSAEDNNLTEGSLSEVKNKESEENVEVEELVDPYPNNALSAEVDIVMEDFNFVLTDFQLNINDYFYGTVNSTIQDYQKKVLLDTGELVNEKIKSINLEAKTDGDKEILYLFEELKKYHKIRFEALLTYLEQPNDRDFKIINDNSMFASDIAMKMIEIRATDLE